MATRIDSSSVLRLFENNLFDYDNDRQLLVYHENGLNIEFAVPWFTNEVGKTYDLAHVREYLGELMKNVEHLQTRGELLLQERAGNRGIPHKVIGVEVA